MGNVNGQYVKLLNPTTGFNDGEPDTKSLPGVPSVTTIVAEQGPASTLKIRSTGYLRLAIDQCFGDGYFDKDEEKWPGGGSLVGVMSYDHLIRDCLGANPLDFAKIGRVKFDIPASIFFQKANNLRD